MSDGGRRASGLVASVEHEDGHTAIRLAGELDRSTVHLVRSLAARVPGGHRVVLDLALVRFVDAGGFRGLCHLTRQLRVLDPHLDVPRVPRCVRRISTFSPVGPGPRGRQALDHHGPGT